MSIIVTLINLMILAAGIYVVNFIVTALRIYIKKNS